MHSLQAWAKRSVNLKLFIIGFLVFLLLIPSAMLGSLIDERQQRRTDVIGEISAKWGEAQTVGGPVLTVPYRHHWKDKKGQQWSRIDHAHFLPDSLNVSAKVATEERYRGIYQAAVYKASIRIEGSFQHPTFDRFKIAANNILWDSAFLTVGISDTKGIQENIIINWGKRAKRFNPGALSKDVFSSGVHLQTPLTAAGENAPSLPFAFEMSLNGSTSLNFLPLGKESHFHVSSAWKDPSFQGSFLPFERHLHPDGFSAEWRVLDLNRNFPQQWLNAAYHVQSDYVGVDFYNPVDIYQKITRAQKYAILFIALTFAVFFFAEMLNKKSIHALLYILAGVALCIFYVLLLALSEHLSFGLSYLIASTAITLILYLFTRSLFSSDRVAQAMGGAIVALYAFLFLLLQLTDFALLIGSIGLFVLLGLAMYFSSKVGWFVENRID